jgi:hypothetical protein
MKKNHLLNTLADFNTSVSALKEANRNDEELEQNHFGDFLMIKYPDEWSEHNYKVWLNHPDNVRQGEPVWQIEYCGKDNGYRWETINQGNY